MSVDGIIVIYICSVRWKDEKIGLSNEDITYPEMSIFRFFVFVGA